MRILLSAFSMSGYSGEKASLRLSFSPEGLDSYSNFLFQLWANPEMAHTFNKLADDTYASLRDSGQQQELSRLIPDADKLAGSLKNFLEDPITLEKVTDLEKDLQDTQMQRTDKIEKYEEEKIIEDIRNIFSTNKEYFDTSEKLD